MRTYLFILLSFFATWGVASTQENESETIARCLQELQSSESNQRKAAVLVLGKYKSPVAITALVKCLKDSNPAVRQSALVALTEEDQKITRETALAILPMLVDEDVHIRRLTSSLLEKLPLSNNRFYGSRIIIRGNLNQSNSLLTPEIAQLLNSALQDPDPSVRRNILTAANTFPGILQRERLEPFFQAEVQELQILALRAYAFCKGEENLRAQALKPLLASPHTAVRQELVYTIANLGETGFSLLDKLVEDSDQAVRISALSIVANDLSDIHLTQIQQALQDDSIPPELRTSLIPSLRRYGTRALPVCAELIYSKVPALRVAAWRILAFQEPEKLPLETFFKGLEDSNKEARQLVMSGIRRATQKNKTADSWTLEQMRPLLTSPFTDVRIFPFRLTTSRELLLEMAGMALSDEETTVRRQAVQTIARFRPADCEEILLAALEDTDQSIRELAAQNLIFYVRKPEISSALREFYPTCQNQVLKKNLERILQKQ